MKVFSSSSGRWFNSSIYSAADRLVKLRNTKSMWEVIDEIVKVWYTLNPKKWNAHIIEVEEERHTRKNKFASSRSGGSHLRYTLDIPETIVLMIRKLYTPEECPMDKKWMLQFAKRYKKFVVAEKL